MTETPTQKFILGTERDYVPCRPNHPQAELVIMNGMRRFVRAVGLPRLTAKPIATAELQETRDRVNYGLDAMAGAGARAAAKLRGAASRNVVADEPWADGAQTNDQAEPDSDVIFVTKALDTACGNE